MPDPKDKQLFNELLQRRSVTIPRLMSDQPLDEQSVPDQMLTGLWNGVIGNPTDAPIPAKIGAALGEINPLQDLRTLGAVSLIPPKMAKQVGRQLVDKISQEAPGMAKIWERLYEAYPRLVGNLANIQMKPIPPIDGQRAMGLHVGMDVAPSDLTDNDLLKFYKENELIDLPKLADSGIAKHSAIVLDPGEIAKQPTRTAAFAAAHELTHKAQNLMSKDFSKRYLDQHISAGYDKNAYEVGANKGGNNFTRRFDIAERDNLSMKDARKIDRVNQQNTAPGTKDPWTWLIEKIGFSAK